MNCKNVGAPALRTLCLAAVCLSVASVTFATAAADAAKLLLVIAPEAFHPALLDFAAHKKQLQVPTELVSLEKVLSKEKGVDDPEKLKRFLYRQWRQRSAGYVLLVGDVDVMPVRYMVLDRVTPAAFDYAFYPSDLYYSDVAKADGSFDDWNAQKEGFHAQYFGEVRGEKNKGEPINYDQVHYLPELAVGRWPVSTPEEVSIVARKSIEYEYSAMCGTNEALKRAAFIAVGGWVDSRPLLRNLAAKLERHWQIEQRSYADKSQTAAELPPNHEQVRGLFNAGVGLVVHTGHGQPDAWEQCFSAGDLAKLTNSSAQPIVISAGCSTAYFAPLPPYGAYVDVNGKEHVGTDNGEKFMEPPPMAAPYQRGKYNGTGLGEQMLKSEGKGAVAYIGCNTGSQPCGLTLVEGFVNAVAESRGARLGDCWMAAIRHYYEKERLATLKPDSGWYPPSIFFQGMKFMLFGDPSLKLPAN